MNDGGERTPKRAAQPPRVVRLVAFAASTLLAVLVLLAAGALRYPLSWTPSAASAPAAIVTEIMRPAPAERPRPPRVVREQNAEHVEDAEEVATPTPANVDESEPPVIVAPVWIQRPRNTARFYPREAFMQGVQGQVVLDCMVEVSGQLNCSVALEAPSNRGFGDAALAIAAAHVMQPATQGGVPVRARYRMIVPFSTRG